jgi:hypothetical protein
MEELKEINYARISEGEGVNLIGASERRTDFVPGCVKDRQRVGIEVPIQSVEYPGFFAKYVGVGRDFREGEGIRGWLCNRPEELVCVGVGFARHKPSY